MKLQRQTWRISTKRLAKLEMLRRFFKGGPRQYTDSKPFLNQMPKRLWPIEFDESEQEIFLGLVAVEEYCRLRMLLYFSLITLTRIILSLYAIVACFGVWKVVYLSTALFTPWQAISSYGCRHSVFKVRPLTLIALYLLCIVLKWFYLLRIPLAIYGEWLYLEFKSSYTMFQQISRARTRTRHA